MVLIKTNSKIYLSLLPHHFQIIYIFAETEPPKFSNSLDSVSFTMLEQIKTYEELSSWSKYSNLGT